MPAELFATLFEFFLKKYEKNMKKIFGCRI